jgi:hypothetical protein
VALQTARVTSFVYGGLAHSHVVDPLRSVAVDLQTGMLVGDYAALCLVCVIRKKGTSMFLSCRLPSNRLPLAFIIADHVHMCCGHYGPRRSESSTPPFARTIVPSLLVTMSDSECGYDSDDPVESSSSALVSLGPAASASNNTEEQSSMVQSLVSQSSKNLTSVVIDCDPAKQALEMDWWSKPILTKLKAAREACGVAKGLRIVSVCTGMFTEGMVAKALIVV